MIKMINIIKGFWSFLSGKKTYTISLLMVILGYLNNDQKMILEGLGLGALRNGVNK
jgi:hypothetical protein